MFYLRHSLLSARMTYILFQLKVDLDASMMQHKTEGATAEMQRQIIAFIHYINANPFNEKMLANLNLLEASCYRAELQRAGFYINQEIERLEEKLL